ncbi:MAG TPA: ankyrin repeat domain-containing protein, partial [Puia sp.]|nr:ankyrin repeat domain-containing protein [Puia sp.]
LFQSIRSGSTDALAQQLRNGADPNDTLQHYSALMAATLNGSIDQMRLLIDHGANVNYVNSLGISALWLAVPDRDKTMLLLDHGADLNVKIEGYGILAKLAAMPGTIDFFHLLIDRGADLKKCAADNSLVYIAAGSGDTAILGFLLRSGFRANDTVSYGDYPINSALNYRSFATVKMLVDSGADVNAHPMNIVTLPAMIGFTPLMTAAWENDKPSFFYLLAHGADPNLRNKKGFTALMLLEASESEDPEMTLALLQHGADPSAKTPDGTNAYNYAAKKGNTQSAEILKKYEPK